MAGPLPWLSRSVVAAMTLVALGSTAQAQYLFRYAVWGNYTPGGDGYPFSDERCAGVTPVINYDNNPLTGNPKFSSQCPGLGADGMPFGEQYAAVLYAFASGSYNFYVGSDDGSGLYIDGTQVMALPGEVPFSSDIVSVYLQGGMDHTYLLNYYENGYGGAAIQATVDGRLNVSAAPDDVFAPVITPDVPPVFLLATGLSVLGVGQQARRRLVARRIASRETASG